MKTISKGMLLCAFAGACAQSGGAKQPTGDSTAPPIVGLTRVAAGDVAPTRIYAQPAVTMAGPLVQVSQPASPTDLVVFHAPEVATTRDVIFVAERGAAPQKYVVPVDTTTGSAIYFSPVTELSKAESQAALADVQILDPAGVPLNVRAPKPNAETGEVAPLPMTEVKLDGMPAGRYTVVVGPVAASYGIHIVTRQWQSPLVMTLQPSTSQFLLGNDAFVDITVRDGATPIEHAVLTGEIQFGAVKHIAAAQIVELGGGAYRALIGQAFSQSTPTGTYTIEVMASGTTPAGVQFSRLGQTALHFAVPTAMIAQVAPAKSVLDAFGKVTHFDIAVTVEVASSDRYEVSAVLASAADGVEVEVGKAQTAATLAKGTHVLTLRFEAGLMKYTAMDGPFGVRDLQLYSQGTNALYHRAGYGMGVHTDSVKSADLARLGEMPPAVEGMIEDGLLPAQ